MICYRADWIVPVVSEPIPEGWVEVEHGRVVRLGSGPAHDAIDLGSVAILPGLVNAHTHLELSYLRGRVPPATRFVDWIRALMAARAQMRDAEDPTILAAARSAIAEARAAGTALVGDVANTLVSVSALHEAGFPAHVFFELLGFNEPDPVGRVIEARARIAAAPGIGGCVRVSLGAHAPYSVSSALFQSIRADLEAHADSITCVHLGESAEELEFLRRGTGPWRTLLEELAVWNTAWSPPETSPVDYLDGLGFFDRRVLAVHGVQLSGEDLRLLQARGVTIVSCPRSNIWVGVGPPPLEAFYAMNVAVAFGTDSLASVDDLNLFGELAEARRIAPRVPARALIRSATLNGAVALGRADEFGSIEPGKRAALIAVRVPPGVHDVEQYLVSGVFAPDVEWIT